MQRIWVISLLLNCALLYTVHAQSGPLDQEVSVSQGTNTIKDILDELSQSNNFTFSYSPNQIPLSKIVFISKATNTLR